MSGLGESPQLVGWGVESSCELPSGCRAMLGGSGSGGGGVIWVGTKANALVGISQPLKAIGTFLQSTKVTCCAGWVHEARVEGWHTCSPPARPATKSLRKHFLNGQAF